MLAIRRKVRAGRAGFDVTGKIPYARSTGQPMARCEFGTNFVTVLGSRRCRLSTI